MFADLHPSPTSGDGQPILRARYQGPTDPPEGHRLCAMCGFQFDDLRNQMGDTLLSPGISYSAPIIQTVNLPVPAGATKISYTETIVEPNVVGGCPFCGSFNASGLFIGDPFDSGVDLTNL